MFKPLQGMYHKAALGGWVPLDRWLGLSAVALLAALVAVLWRRRGSTAKVEPAAMSGVISAADEAATFGK